jgi:hypothetical protein
MTIGPRHGFAARLTLFVTLVLALAGVGGCSSEGEKMVESYASTRETVAKAQRQVDKTLVSLHGLRSTPVPAIKDGFRDYKGDVEKLEAQGTDAKKRAAVLRDRQDSHIQAWEKEVAQLKDPAIKATMEQRREALPSNYKLLMMYADDVRKAYGPFLTGNKDVVQALSLDLSPAAISSLSPAIDGVLLNGQQLQQKLALMQIALNNMANGISPIGGMAGGTD